MADKTVLNKKVNEIINDYRAALVQNGIPVEKIILFGSRAKGTARNWSDIDLCVISKIFGHDHFDEMVRLKRLTVDVEPLIEPHPYHPNDLKEDLDPLIHEIRTYGQEIPLDNP